MTPSIGYSLGVSGSVSASIYLAKLGVKVKVIFFKIIKYK